MGFPLGYSQSFPLKLVLCSLSLLGFILTPIFSLLCCLGLPYFKNPSFESFREYPTRVPGDPTISAAFIKELLPSAKFGDIASSSAGLSTGSCAVCLYEFKVGNEIRWLKNCKHIFHRSCVDRWIDHGQNTCPLCRITLMPGHMQDEFKRRLF